MSHSHAESLLLHQRIRRVRDLLLSANYKDLSTNDELLENILKEKRTAWEKISAKIKTLRYKNEDEILADLRTFFEAVSSSPDHKQLHRENMMLFKKVFNEGSGDVATGSKVSIARSEMAEMAQQGEQDSASNSCESSHSMTRLFSTAIAAMRTHRDDGKGGLLSRGSFLNANPGRDQDPDKPPSAQEKAQQSQRPTHELDAACSRTVLTLFSAGSRHAPLLAPAARATKRARSIKSTSASTLKTQDPAREVSRASRETQIVSKEKQGAPVPGAVGISVSDTGAEGVGARHSSSGGGSGFKKVRGKSPAVVKGYATLSLGHQGNGYSKTGSQSDLSSNNEPAPPKPLIGVLEGYWEDQRSSEMSYRPFVHRSETYKAGKRGEGEGGTEEDHRGHEQEGEELGGGEEGERHFIAEIEVLGDVVSLGEFDSPTKAAEAHDRALMRAVGPGACSYLSSSSSTSTSSVLQQSGQKDKEILGQLNNPHVFYSQDRLEAFSAFDATLSRALMFKGWEGVCHVDFAFLIKDGREGEVKQFKDAKDAKAAKEAKEDKEKRMLLERKKREREELDKIERAALALLPDERRKKKKVKRDKKETATYGLDSQAFAPVDASIAGTERLRKGLSALERIPSYSLPDIRDMSGKGKLVANGPQGGSGAEDQAVAVPTPTSSSASASASASTSVPTDGGRRPVRTAHAARHRFRVYDRVHEKARVSDIPAMFTYAVAQEVILAGAYLSDAGLEAAVDPSEIDWAVYTNPYIPATQKKIGGGNGNGKETLSLLTTEGTFAMEGGGRFMGGEEAATLVSSSDNTRGCARPWDECLYDTAQARERLAEFREDVRDTMVRLGLRIKPDASFECSADRKLVGVKCLSAAHRQTFLLELPENVIDPLSRLSSPQLVEVGSFSYPLEAAMIREQILREGRALDKFASKTTCATNFLVGEWEELKRFHKAMVDIIKNHGILEAERAQPSLAYDLKI